MEDSAAAATTFEAPPNQKGTTTPKKYSHLSVDTLSHKSSSYTSLKDMLPFTAAAAVNSPTASASSASSVSIRNRLVKQAAWAYLQPMSPSPCGPSGPLRRLRLRFSSDSRHRRRCNPLTPCLSFVSHLIAFFTGVWHQILHAITGQVPII